MAKQSRPRSTGKHAVKHQTYRASGRLLRKKLRNVIKHSGFAEGERWARQNDALATLAYFEKAKNDLGQPLRWLERAKVAQK